MENKLIRAIVLLLLMCMITINPSFRDRAKIYVLNIISYISNIIPRPI